MRNIGRTFIVAVAGVLFVASMGHTDDAARPPTARIVRVKQAVEVLRKGNTEWVRAEPDTSLSESEQIRTSAGGFVTLSLADGSNVQLAENSRLVVTKLDYDSKSRDRLMTFHLVLGKIRASVAPGTAAPEQWKSTFLVSTPQGVTAVRREATVVIAYHPTTEKGFCAVLSQPGQTPGMGAAVYVGLRKERQFSPLVVSDGTFITHVGAESPTDPVPIDTPEGKSEPELSWSDVSP